jgi:hypothetical protein
VKFLTAFLGLLLVLAASLARAQSQDPASTPASSVKPADAPANPPNNATNEKKKPKKVWTNDEIKSVKGDVSVVGDANSSSRSGSSHSSSSSSANGARQQQIENYRNQIQGYKDGIDAIDKHIAQLKDFKAEDTSPSGGINISHGYDMVPLEDQVKQLEAKKKELQTKIDDTEVEARKDGIEPGDLR